MLCELSATLLGPFGVRPDAELVSTRLLTLGSNPSFIGWRSVRTYRLHHHLHESEDITFMLTFSLTPTTIEVTNGHLRSSTSAPEVDFSNPRGEATLFEVYDFADFESFRKEWSVLSTLSAAQEYYRDHLAGLRPVKSR